MEAAADTAEISKRGIKEVAKESKVKAAAADSVSSTRTLSADTVASNAASAFAGYPTYTSIFVGVDRISWYTLIVIML